MTRTAKNILIIIIAIIIVGLLVWWGVGREKEGEAIKIGHIMPLTGDLANIGEEVRNAIELAAEQLNNAGGIDGCLIQLIHEDGRCEGKTALTAAQKLINVDGVKLIIGAGCSGETLAIAPLANERQIVLMSPASTSPEITKAGDFIFRNIPSDAFAGKLAAEFAYNVYEVRKAAYLAEMTDYAKALADVFAKEFQALGGTIVEEQIFNPGATDIRTQILKIKSKEPELIYVAGQTDESGAIVVKQIKESGLEAKLLGCELFDSDDVISVAGDAVEGLVYFVQKFDQQNPPTQKFLEAYEAKYGQTPDNAAFVTNAYDIANIYFDALKEFGEDPVKIKDYLYTIKDYNGAGGKFSIDENGDCQKEYQIMIIKSGQPEPYQE